MFLMNDSTLNLIKYVFLAVDLIVIISLVLMIVKGLRKGIYKFLMSTGLKWILILILILFSGLIAKSVLTINLGGEIGRLDTYLMAQLAEMIGMTEEQMASSYTYDLAYSAIVSTLRIVIILLAIILVNIIVYPLVSLFLWIFGVKRKVNNIIINRKIRICGAVFGLFIFCINFLVVFAPIYGVLSIATTFEKEIAAFETTEERQPQAEEETVSIGEMTEKSFLLKIINADGSKNFCVAYLDNIYVIETENATIHLIDEAYKIKPLIPTVAKVITSAGGDFDLSKVSQEDIQQITDYLKESSFTEALLPVAVEVVVATGALEDMGVDLTLEDVHNIDWSTETEKIISFVDVVAPVYGALIDSETGELFQDLTPENIEKILAKFDLSDVEKIETLLYNLTSLEIIKFDELIKNLIEENELEDELAEAGIKLDLDNIDWNNEIPNLAQVINVFVSNPDLIKVFTDFGKVEFTEQDKNDIHTLLSSIINSKLINQSIPGLILKLLEEGEALDYATPWLHEQKENFVASEWESQVDIIVDVLDVVLRGAYSGDINFDDFEKSNFEFFKGLLHDLELVKIVNVENVLNAVLKSELEIETNIFTIPDDVNWDQEADLIFNNETGALRQLLQVDNPDTEENETYITCEDFGRFYDTISKSSLVTENVYEVMVEYVDAVLYDLDPEYTKEAVEASTLKYMNLMEQDASLTWASELAAMEAFIDAYRSGADDATLATLAGQSTYITDLLA